MLCGHAVRAVLCCACIHAVHAVMQLLQVVLLFEVVQEPSHSDDRRRIVFVAGGSDANPDYGRGTFCIGPACVVLAEQHVLCNFTQPAEGTAAFPGHTPAFLAVTLLQIVQQLLSCRRRCSSSSSQANMGQYSHLPCRIAQSRVRIAAAK